MVFLVKLLFEKLLPVECITLTISYHLYFLRISKAWSKLHRGSVGRVQGKECYIMFTYTFFDIFCCFSSKNCVFIIFTSFLMKYEISATEYLPIKNWNWWQEIVSETMSNIFYSRDSRIIQMLKFTIGGDLKAQFNT